MLSALAPVTEENKGHKKVFGLKLGWFCSVRKQNKSMISDDVMTMSPRVTIKELIGNYVTYNNKKYQS